MSIEGYLKGFVSLLCSHRMCDMNSCECEFMQTHCRRTHVFFLNIISVSLPIKVLRESWTSSKPLFETLHANFDEMSGLTCEGSCYVPFIFIIHKYIHFSLNRINTSVFLTNYSIMVCWFGEFHSINYSIGENLVLNGLRRNMCWASGTGMANGLIVYALALYINSNSYAE